MSKTCISVVTTTYNETENIAELIQRLRNTLTSIPHEIIVVDDSSPDDTYRIAKLYADVAIKKPREGQTIGLLYGIKLAKYSTVLTIDSDLENPPEIIPKLIATFTKMGCDILVASRSSLPRFSEVLASKTLGQILGVSDVFSNFRVYRKELFINTDLKMGETFGAELLLLAKKRGYQIGEYRYVQPKRREHPRIGGRFRANLRILHALAKTLKALAR